MKIRRIMRVVLSVFAVLILASLGARAQFTSGIEGTVKDASGAVVPQAHVTVINEATEVKRTVQSNASGYFRLSSIPPADYRIEVQLQGFKTWIQQHLNVAAGETRTIAPVLEVGSTVTQVSVSAAPSALELSKASTSRVINPRLVQDLPLIGRRAYSMAALIPGVTGTGQQYGSINNVFGSDNYGTSNTPSINAAGQRLESNSVEVDGVYVMAMPRGGMIQFSPNPETIQEISASTNVFSAVHSHNSGVLVDIVTKSGTNNWHGDLSEYHSDNHMTARQITQSDVPAFTRNEFGFVIGGPIKKDHTFVFGGFHALRSAVSQLRVGTVETPEFSSYVESNFPNTIAAKILSIDPPFSNPTANIITVAQLALRNPPHFSAPAIPGNLPAVGTAYMSRRVPRNGEQFNIRVDQNFNQFRDRVYFQFFRTNSRQLSVSDRPNQEWMSPNDSNWLKADWTHTLSPTLFNEASFSLFQPWQENPGNKKTYVIPQINVSGISGFGAWAPANYAQNNYQWSDILHWIRGNHSFQVGYQGQRVNDQTTFGNINNTPVYNFASLLDFIQDLPITQSGPAVNPVKGGYGAMGTSQNMLNNTAFVQDNWKVRPTLTLNLGISYTNWGHIASTKPYAYGYFRGGTGATPSGNAVANGGVVVPPNGWGTVDRIWALEPRVGFAWDVLGNGKTALRAGYGIFRDRPFDQIINPSMLNPPSVATPSLSVFEGTGSEMVYGLGDSNHENFPLPNVQYQLNSQNGLVGTRVGVGGIEPALTLPLTDEWMVGIQHRFGSNMVMELDYTGTRSHDLWLRSDVNRFNGDLLDGTLNRFNQSFSAIQYLRNGATAHSNVGSFMIRKRLSRGFSITGIYTMSKAIDTSSTNGSGGEGTTNTVDAACIKCERGRSAFDASRRLSIDGLWQLPSLWQHGALSKVFGGWSLTGIAILESGLPFSVYTTQPFPAGDYNADGLNYDRPNTPAFGTTLHVTSRQKFLSGIFTRADFPVPTPGTNGNLPRNTFENPGYADVDVNVLKTTHIPWFTPEGARFELRGEIFNLFNRPNLGNVVNNLASGTFGTVTNSVNPRSIQVGARILF